MELGEAKVFALRSGDGKERATAVIEPPMGPVEEAEFTNVYVAVPRKQPFHPAALVALGELLQGHGSSGLHIQFEW